MTFADVNRGDAVFVDANTFIYHFTPDPILGPPCSQLLQRIENQELTGFTSLHVLAEVAHKLMTIEANRLYGWPFAGMANRLRRHPAEVQQLSLFSSRLTYRGLLHSFRCHSQEHLTVTRNERGQRALQLATGASFGQARLNWIHRRDSKKK